MAMKDRPSAWLERETRPALSLAATGQTVPPPAAGPDLRGPIEALRAREAELQEYLELRRRVNRLETQCFLGGSIRDQEALAEITRIVAAEFDVPKSALKSPSRKEPLPTARALIWYFGRQFTNLTWVMLGGVCCKDHGSAIYGDLRIRERLEVREDYIVAVVGRLEALIRAAIKPEQSDLPGTALPAPRLRQAGTDKHGLGKT